MTSGLLLGPNSPSGGVALVCGETSTTGVVAFFVRWLCAALGGEGLLKRSLAGRAIHGAD